VQVPRPCPSVGDESAGDAHRRTRSTHAGAAVPTLQVGTGPGSRQLCWVCVFLRGGGVGGRPKSRHASKQAAHVEGLWLTQVGQSALVSA
jgi:hypothetical protein